MSIKQERLKWTFKANARHSNIIKSNERTDDIEERRHDFQRDSESFGGEKLESGYWKDRGVESLV